LRTETIRLALDQQELGQAVTHDYPALYPNLHLAYDLGEGRQWTASVSRRTNAPYSEQLDPLPLSQTPFLLTAGNPDLRPEDAYAYELAYERRQGDRTTTATLYYRETRDAFSTLTTQLPSAVMLQTTVNAGAVRRAGGEWATGGKLTGKLHYNLSLDGYWTQISAANLGIARTRSAVTGFGRGSLSYQLTPKDFVQLDLFSNGKRLLPQGYVAPNWSANIGYRHTITSKASWMLVIDDPFDSQRYRTVETIGGIESRRLERQASRSISLALVINFAGKPKDAGFEFGAGAER
jgi:outer membrane receptor protein involved in Fe transport